MTLSELMISPRIQEEYAEQIAIEDISMSSETDTELLKSNNINIGEIG